MDFSKLSGLIPAVVQDETSGEVLMVGFMNDEALQLTKSTGFATFFSRSRNALWTKGETSGNRLKVTEILVDCDEDTVLLKVTRLGDGNVLKHDLSSLRVLGTVGEPINPEAWLWYHRIVGKERCPIVDTWWQTETGAAMIAPLPGVQTLAPGSATRPLPGIDADIVTKEGKSVEAGFLVIRKSWPSQLRGIWGDGERFRKTYLEEMPGFYFAGDGARRDFKGNFWIMGRVDDVLNVSGHRLGTAEVESALVSHPDVAEAAVVGRLDAIKGEAIVAFVTLKTGRSVAAEMLKLHVVKEIGALARPDEIRFAESLPKTRSGKIMRRLLRDLARGEESSGDTSTLEDRGVLDRLRASGPDED